MSQDKEEVRRLLDVARTLTRMLGISNREVERRMGLNPSTLTRIYGGTIEAKVEAVLGIARAIGLEYEEFFEFAYPDRPDTPSESAVKLRSMLAGLQPSRNRTVAPAAPSPPEKKEAPTLDRPDIEKMLEDLRQEVRDLLEQQQVQEKKKPAASEGKKKSG